MTACMPNAYESEKIQANDKTIGTFEPIYMQIIGPILTILPLIII